jgi:hypothetical protein
MLYKVALDPIMLYKLDNHSLNSSLLQPTAMTNLLVKINQFLITSF